MCALLFLSMRAGGRLWVAAVGAMATVGLGYDLGEDVTLCWMTDVPNGLAAQREGARALG